MLPIRGESDSWRASDLSTLPQGLLSTKTPLYTHRLTPGTASTISTCHLFLSYSCSQPNFFPPLLFFMVGMSRLQITDTKRGGTPPPSPAHPEPPVSFNESMKLYFSTMRELNSFLCDSWLGNVSVNLIKDSAVLIIFCQVSYLMAFRCIICIPDWSRVAPIFLSVVCCWLFFFFSFLS